MKTAFDALVVLGGGINPAGEIPDFVKTRIDLAITISANKIPIIMTGRWSFLIPYIPPRTEASAMKEYALRHDPAFDAEKILLEQESLDTIGNAYYTAGRYLAPQGWRHILIITSDFHIDRATYIFQKVLGKDYIIEGKATPGNLMPDDLKAKAAVEAQVLAFIKQHLDPIRDGDLEAIRRVITLFPGYSPEPQYTRAELLKIVDTTELSADTYGIRPT